MEMLGMETTSIATLLAAVFGGGALGTLTTIGTQYLLASRKQSDAQDVTLVQHIADQSREIITRLEVRILKLEADHAECTENYLKITMEFGELKGKLDALQQQVGHTKA